MAPPVPWNAFTGPAAAAPGAAGAAGVAAGGMGSEGGVWPYVTVLTEARTDCAADMVKPALVRPVTNPRRETPFDKYLTTSSRMFVSPKCDTSVRWVPLSRLRRDGRR